ncbi:bacterial Ig-like domain-containing protein [Candidatus Enterococcus huntleyi]|uniref:bacterial Ig-like domain-containing protein n=1 Tax=Candidatus Enterococcus huntleyi TaxID=1857217 RepID=UPI00137B8E54|nr:bacterial Ig-like domain-containing protein [Enterococcus sp. JM4C]
MNKKLSTCASIVLMSSSILNPISAFAQSIDPTTSPTEISTEAKKSDDNETAASPTSQSTQSSEINETVSTDSQVSEGNSETEGSSEVPAISSSQASQADEVAATGESSTLPVSENSDEKTKNSSEETKSSESMTKEKPEVRVSSADPYGFFASHLRSSQIALPDYSGLDWTIYQERAITVSDIAIIQTKSGVVVPLDDHYRLVNNSQLQTTYQGFSSTTPIYSFSLDDYGASETAGTFDQTYAYGTDEVLKSSLFLADPNPLPSSAHIKFDYNGDSYVRDFDATPPPHWNFESTSFDVTPAADGHISQKLVQDGQSTGGPNQFQQTMTFSLANTAAELATEAGPVATAKSGISMAQNEPYTDYLATAESALDEKGSAVSYEWVLEPDTSTIGASHAVVLVKNANGYRSLINIPIEIVANQKKIDVHGSTIYVGDSWKAEDNFDEATDQDGKPIDFSQLTVDGKVDTSKAGTYEVTYTYDGLTSTATIIVVPKLTEVTAKDSEIYVDDPWKAEDNFVSAKDKDGQPVDFSEITVDTSQVDTSKAGTFEVTYTYDGVSDTATITVKERQTAVIAEDSTIYVGDSWKAEDNFVSAKDKAGNPVEFSEVTVDESQVDTSKAGSFEVTYTYDGVSDTATITVKERQTAVTAEDSTIYVGDEWKAEDNFVSAKDKAGNPVEFSEVIVDESQVDTSKAGSFEVTYTYDGVSAKATITVKERQTAVTAKDSEMYVGDEWKAEDNFVSAQDKAGQPVDLSKVTVDDSQVDTSKAGSFEVTYTYDGVSDTATITVKERQTAVTAKDSEMYVGDEWKAEMNFDSAQDKAGNPVELSKITVDESQVDTSKAGTFEVTYTYDGVSDTATVTVIDKQTAVNVHDSTVYVGDEWKAEENFDSALDKAGKDVAFSEITVDESQVDTSKAGSFEVTYTYDGVTATATITVLDKQTAVNVHDSTVYVGDEWKAEENFDSALDKAGKDVAFSEITVDESQVDTSKAGSFEVTYTYEGITATATITVVDKQTAVNVHDSTIYVGDEWQAEDNFDKALDKAGKDVAFSEITVDESQADISKAGSFEVTYTYEGVTATATITVVDKQTAVNVHDSTVYVGDEWKAEENFDSALNKAGQPVEFSEITVDESQVDTSKAGSFEVTYTYEGVSATATITVVDKQTAVNVHDSTVYVGDEWQAEDNFDKALDKAGKDVAFSEITVDESQADTSKAGSFEVTYTYEGITATATITVVDKQTAVNVHDSTIYVGDEWKAEENFDSALDKAGKDVAFSEITVDESQVDTSKAGTFEVTYTYEGVTATATITVVDKQTAVNVHDSTIYVGDEWQAEENFDSALDKAGKDVAFSEITVDESQVDTSKAGTFEVTYTYEGVTATATITVVDKQTAVNVHDSTIYVGDEWQAEDNFDKALDKAGKDVAFNEITVDASKADTSKAGSFEVTYTYEGVSATATITVVNKQTAVNVHDSTVYVGDEWKAEENFDSALDKAGKDVEFSEITVDESQADTSKAGSFEVTYMYEGVTAAATITVVDKQTAVNVHDSTIYVGDKWKAEDNFDNALDKDGNSVVFSEITVDDSKADTSKAGTFEVTYTYEGITATAMITVKSKPVIPDEKYQVIVHYVDENGNEISESVVLEGQLGETYRTEEKKIKGYTLVKKPENESGEFIENPEEVVYVYAKEAKLPVTDSEKGKGNTGNAGNIKNNDIHQTVKRLPQTGEEIKSYFPIIGGIMILLTGAIFFFKKDRNRK